MAKRLIPLLDRILVEKLSPPAKSIGGVLLPDAAGKVMRDMLPAVCNNGHDICGDICQASLKPVANRLQQQ